MRLSEGTKKETDQIWLFVVKAIDSGSSNNHEMKTLREFGYALNHTQTFYCEDTSDSCANTALRDRLMRPC
jgi:hypothetical protein